jgi:hypothetical protein
MQLLVYTFLLPAGIGIFLGIGGLFVLKDRDENFGEHLAAMILFFLSGLGVAVSVLLDPHLASLLTWFRTRALFGVNIMLAVMVWSAMLTWYEAVKQETFEASSHYVRTPVAVWLFAFSLPLWSLNGLRPGGVGLVLLGAMFIVIRKMGKEGRKIAPWLAAGAAFFGSLQVSAWIGGYSGLHIWGVGIVLVVIFLAGLKVIFTVLRAKDNGKYHHWRGPLYVGLLVSAVMLAVGGPAYSLVNQTTGGGTTTVAKVSHPGDDGNPFDPIARAIGTALESHASR